MNESTNRTVARRVVGCAFEWASNLALAAAVGLIIAAACTLGDGHLRVSLVWEAAACLATCGVLLTFAPADDETEAGPRECGMNEAFQGQPDLSRKLIWCRACDAFLTKADLDASGAHSICGERPEVETARKIFAELTLEAIPADLLATRAVGSGDARRCSIAASVWPQVERVIAALDRGRQEAGR